MLSSFLFNIPLFFLTSVFLSYISYNPILQQAYQIILNQYP